MPEVPEEIIQLSGPGLSLCLLYLLLERLSKHCNFNPGPLHELLPRALSLFPRSLSAATLSAVICCSGTLSVRHQFIARSLLKGC